MEEVKESLRRQLLEARATVQAQIDRLRGLPLPLAGVDAAPFGGGGVQSSEAAIARLSETLRAIDDSLAALGDGR